MSPDLPTYLPTIGPEYLSLRLKVDHAFLEKILVKLVHDVPDYCIYKHSTSGEHFHICFPGSGRADVNRIAKRVKDNFGVTGNGGYSLKFFDNGCSSFVFYCGHEGLTPCFQNQEWQKIIDATSSYFVKPVSGQKMLPLVKSSKKDGDADWQLTYSNFVSKAINHARTKGLTGSLKEVLQDMLETTKWRPSFHMVKNGVPDHYYKDYEFRSGKRQRLDMSWMDVKF